MTDSMIRIDHVAKYFGDLNKPAVNDIFLSVNKNEFLTILGPSGCGKTTTLRMIAGFEKPTSGKIFIDGEDVTSLPPYMRNVNTVFQNYALFPHLNIFDNVAFGLNMKKTPKDEIKEKVTAMLNMVQLDGYADRMPDQLSGGQKQRVAIARAIVNNPKVLLLDEPLGALDLKLRKQMQTELKHLQRKLGITFVYVTHDQEEALTMSDRIVIVNEGKIEQVGTPDEIYEKPKTKFVADFIGETNLFEGKVTNVEDKAAEFEMNDGDKIYVDPFGLSAGEDVYIAVRPERIKLKSSPSKDENSIEGKLKERIYVGSNMKTIITVKDGKDVVVNEPVDDMFKFTKDNNDVFITWDTKNSVVMKS